MDVVFFPNTLNSMVTKCNARDDRTYRLPYSHRYSEQGTYTIKPYSADRTSCAMYCAYSINKFLTAGSARALHSTGASHDRPSAMGQGRQPCCSVGTSSFFLW